MSALHFLPRLVSWSNLYKIKIPSDQELAAMTMKLEKSSDKEKTRFRKKISYWSDDEMRNYHSRTESKPKISYFNPEPEFVTKWRPQTTFGYENNFDIKRHQKLTLIKFDFRSKPKILRRLGVSFKIIGALKLNNKNDFRNHMSGVKLAPIQPTQRNRNKNTKISTTERLKSIDDGYSSDLEDLDDNDSPLPDAEYFYKDLIEQTVEESLQEQVEKSNM